MSNNYYIINMAELPNFIGKVICKYESVRTSLDNWECVVKTPIGAAPMEGCYTHAEILQIMNTPEWDAMEERI